MLKSLLFVLLLGSVQFSCKSTGGGTSDTWATQENRDAAVSYIKYVVAELFPGVEETNPALQEFAVALQDSTSKQIESSEYLLRKYNEQRRTNPKDINAEIASYIAEHFLAMTNYVAVYTKETSELKYLGLDGALADTSKPM